MHPSGVRLVELPEGLIPASLGDAAFVEGEPALRSLCNNAAKYGAVKHIAASGAGRDPLKNGGYIEHGGYIGAGGDSHVWTVMSSGDFGAAHKHP